MVKEFNITWEKFKTFVDTNHLTFMEMKNDTHYNLVMQDGQFIYNCSFEHESFDGDEYEASYQSKAGTQPYQLKWSDGKNKVSSTSRPEVGRLQFSGMDDYDNVLAWDFGNTDNDVTAPTGYKRKQIDAKYNQHIWMKEGSIYFKNKEFGSYIDFQIVALAGTPGFHPTEDTVIDHFVVHHNMMYDAPMGDELNTEAALETPVPPGLVFRFIITVPDTDSTSQGAVSLEFYRGDAS